MRRPARCLAIVLSVVATVTTACTSRSDTAPGSLVASATTGTHPTRVPSPATQVVVRRVATLPAPVQRAVAVTDGSSVVIAGGLDAGGSSVTGVFRLDPNTGATTKLGDVPQAFHDAAGALLGKTLFVFGGGTSTSSDAIQAFDLSTKEARIVGHLPTVLSDLGAATIGDTAYLAGGWNGVSPQPTVWSTSDGRRFVKVAALPVGLRYPAVAAADGELFIAGGATATGAEVGTVTRVDPATGKVSRLATLPRPVAHAMAFVVNGTLYVAGGQDANGNSLAAVWAVDTRTGDVTAASKMPLPLADAAVAAEPDGGAVLVGGFSAATSAAVLTSVVAPARTSTASPVASAAPVGGAAPISTTYARGLPSVAGRRPFGGLLLVADRGNDRLLVLNPGGRVVWTYPSPSLPAPPFPFYFPDDAFWVHGGHAILVNEEENDVLAEIAYPSGKTLWTYGHPRTPGSSTGYVHQPDDLYPYPGGGMVVSDARNCRILFFSPKGTPIRQIGRTGACTAGLPVTIGYPNGDTPLPNGDLLISEIYGGRVSRVTATGKVIWSTNVPGLHVPSDPQLLSDGTVLVVDYGHPGAVIRFTPGGKRLWYYHPTSGPGVLDHPSLAAPLPNGLVAVTDDYNDRVVLIDPTTDRIVYQYGHTRVPGTAPGYLDTPDGLDLLLPGGIAPLHLDFPSPRTHPGRP